MTVDGFIAGPNSEMDWMKFPWTDDIMNYVREVSKPVDTIILGKNLAQGFIPHWTAALENPAAFGETEEGARKMVETPKVVFTKTMEKSIWANTELAKGDLVNEVNALKQKKGGDIIVYGGGTFVSSLIKAQLIDEFHLFINPVAIGKGMAIFKEVETKQPLILQKSIGFDCGIVLQQYVLQR